MRMTLPTMMAVAALLLASTMALGLPPGPMRPPARPVVMVTQEQIFYRQYAAAASRVVPAAGIQSAEDALEDLGEDAKRKAE